MRTLDKNKQTMKYALFKEMVKDYERDNDGNIRYTEVDGELVPIESGMRPSYYEPVPFKANIYSVGNGNVVLAGFGADEHNYKTAIVCSKNEFPFDNQTIFFYKSEPEYNDLGELKPESADYRIDYINDTDLNQDEYVLKKNVK